MSTFERIKYLCKKRGISIKDLSEKLGFGASTIYKWKKQAPKSEYLVLVAEYFDVSVDYLMGSTDNPQKSEKDIPDLADDSAIFAFDGKPVSDEEREFLKSVIETYRKNKK